MNSDFKIVSGGQTGVDRAALEWAIEHNVPHSGWCPKGRRAEDGPIPPQFKLQETDSTNYLVRTHLNIRDSDATLIFAAHAELRSGTKATADFANEARKPLLVLLSSADAASAAETLQAFLKAYNVSTLNVAGPRASGAPKIGVFVKDVLSRALNQSIQ